MYHDIFVATVDSYESISIFERSASQEFDN